MEFVTVKPEIQWAFEPLIPAELKQQLHDRPDLLAIGAVEEHVPCGILLAAFEARRIRLLWLYTSEEMRERGVARSLVRLLCGRALQDPEADQLVADVPRGSSSDTAFWLLLTEGWNPVRFSVRDYSCTLAELAQQPFWQRHMQLDGVSRLSNVAPGLLAQYSAWLSKQPEYAAVDLPLRLERYNQSLSFGYLSGGRLQAILLAGGTEDELVLEYAQSQSSAARGFAKLVYAAGKQAIAMYPPETRVALAAITPAAERLASKLLPHSNIRDMYRMLYSVKGNA